MIWGTVWRTALSMARQREENGAPRRSGGLGQAERYLHDGRARTLAEAIDLHGGEAKASRNAFQALSAEQRDQLLSFLAEL